MSWIIGKGKKKPVSEDKRQAFSTETIVTGDLQSVVVLPDGEDLNEWLASNTLSFFNNINLYYSVISELCTPQNCPVMSAGGKTEYSWLDDKGKRSKGVSAPQYIDYVMTFIQKQLNEESVFPTKFGASFPKDFQALVKKIFKYLFHVLAHMYHAHVQQIVGLGLEAHLNTLLIHFTLFAQEFKLLDQKELLPLADLIKQLTL